MTTKQAGVIERLQDELAPDVFSNDKRLFPDIRRQILKTVKEIEPDTEKVKGVYLLGSLTGYRYTAESDLDIMITVKDLEATREKTKETKRFNGRIAVGTKRPIAYFLTGWNENSHENLKEIGFGVYDVLADKWHVQPKDREKVAPTFAKFWGEFIVADSKARYFNELVKDYKAAKREMSRMMASKNREDLFEYYQIERQKKKVNDLFKKALDFVDEVDKDRKIAYSSG